MTVISRSVARQGAMPGRDGNIWALAGLLIFIAIALLTGGGSRPDVTSLLILRPLSAVAIVAALALITPLTLANVRAPLAFLAALAGLMVVQLVPLPPALWTALPGRSIFEAGAILGVAEPWRPISLSPLRTWNSLVALVPALAALLLVAQTPERRRPWVLLALMIALGLSAVLGLAQRAGPEGGPLYFYRITNEGSAVGFFANRNHQAAMLACLFPMLATYCLLGSKDGRPVRQRMWIAGLATLSLIPLILATGSRTGLALSIIAVLSAAFLIWKSPAARSERRPNPRGKLFAAAAIGAAALLAGITIWLAQADAVTRFTWTEVSDDLRFRLFSTLAKMMGDFFPVGSGFGSFENVFRAYEPDSSLGPAYVNSAHNDLFQLVIEAGLPGVLLLAAFLLWLARASLRAWRASPPLSTRIQMARLGSILIGLLLLASLTDYPLRTPFVMIVMTIACAWLSLPGHTAAADGPSAKVA